MFAQTLISPLLVRLKMAPSSEVRLSTPHSRTATRKHEARGQQSSPADLQTFVLPYVVWSKTCSRSLRHEIKQDWIVLVISRS